MNQAIYKSNYKNRKLILTMAIVAICGVSVTIFNLLSMIISGRSLAEEAVFGFLIFLAKLAPCIMLLVYVFKPHDRSGEKLFVPLVYGLMCVPTFLIFAEHILFEAAHYYQTEDGMVSEFVSLVVGFAPFILALVATALTGKVKKILLIVAAGVGLYLTLNSYAGFFADYVGSAALHAIINLLGFVGTCAFYVALLFLCGIRNQDTIDAPNA